MTTFFAVIGAGGVILGTLAILALFAIRSAQASGWNPFE